MNIAPIIASSRVRGGVSYDEDFQAWIDFNTSKGYYLPEESKLNEANNQILRDKANGHWDRVDIYFLFVWNDLQCDDCSLVCVKRLVEGVAYGGMIYTEKGWEGDGVTGYFNPKFNPLNDGVNFDTPNAGRFMTIYKETIIDRSITGVQQNNFWNATRKSSIFVRYVSFTRVIDFAIDLTGAGMMAIIRNPNISTNNITIYNKDLVQVRSSLPAGANYNSDFMLLRAGGELDGTGGLLTDAGFSNYTEGRGNYSDLEVAQIRSDFNMYLSGIGLPEYA